MSLDRGRARRGLVGAVAFALLGACLDATLVGCAEGEADEPDRRLTEFCAAVCDFRSRCYEEHSYTCGASCLDWNDAFFARVQPEYLTLVSACWEQVPCLDDVEPWMNECAEAKGHEVTPTPAAYALCETHGLRFFECGYDAGDECVEWYKVASDAALTAAAQCTGGSCSALFACIDAALS